MATTDSGEAAAATVAALACGWAARRAAGKDRLGWTLMRISAGCWAAGEVPGRSPKSDSGRRCHYPSLADAGFLAAVPFAVAALRAFWDAPRGTSA